MSLYLVAFQWVWVISGGLAIWNEITYNATYSVGLGGYSWWLGAASYATVLGAVIFTITNLMAVHTEDYAFSLSVIFSVPPYYYFSFLKFQPVLPFKFAPEFRPGLFYWV